MGKPKMGRASIFRGKENGVRIQAIITKAGGRKFEAARKELTKLYEEVVGRKPGSVSDADVVEFLARGPIDTQIYLDGEK